MDFLITQSSPPKSISNQYVKSDEAEAVRLHYSPSPNLHAKKYNGVVNSIISGVLFGSLKNTQDLKRHDKSELGQKALKSDGSFAVAIPSSGSVTIVTDAGGSIPVYYGHGTDGFAVGTLVHHVAASSGLESIDHVSVVDFLFNETICFPYSWFEDVRVVSPGSVCTFDAKSKDVHTYWVPREPDNIYEESDERAWGQRIRQQIQDSIGKSIQDKNVGRVLYSGGLDSRSVLSLVPESFNCIPTTILDEKNREYKLAKQSAKLLGRNLDWIPRPKNYYKSNIRKKIQTLGPGWDFRHAHVFGEVANRLEDVEVLFGGYKADALLKTAYVANIEQRRTKPARLIDPRPDRIKKPNFLGGEMGLASLWSVIIGAVQERRLAHHKRLKKIRPLTAGNWHSLWPVSAFTFAHYLACLRMDVRVTEPFIFSNLYRIAAKMPDTCRINQKAFRCAFAPPMGMAAWLPTSSGRIPKLSALTGELAKGAIQKYRTWHSMITGKRGHGPWPADHVGWSPVKPEDHFPEKSRKRLYQRLEDLLTDGQARQFFENTHLPSSMQVRALTMAFDWSL